MRKVHISLLTAGWDIRESNFSSTPVALLQVLLCGQASSKIQQISLCLMEMGKLTKNLDDYTAVWTVTTEILQGT
jgi:hypothetical protein